MPLIKTLSQTLKQDKKIQSTEVCPAGDPDPQDLAGRYFSGGEQVFPDIPVYGYQLFHCQQSG